MNLLNLLHKIETIRKASQRTETSRLSPEARIKAEDRERVSQAKAQEDLKELLAEINEGDAKKSKLTRRFLTGYGLGDFLTSDELLDEIPPHPDAMRWGAFYNYELYQKILPLCELAHLEEQNGLAREHALRLSLIFDNERAVVDYLLSVAKLTPSNYLVHDASNFDVPFPEHCDFKQWKFIANKKTYMTNARFRDLLPSAGAIEELAKGREDWRKNIKAIGTKEKEIQAVNNAYTKLEQTPIEDATDEQKSARKEQLKQWSQQKSNLCIELAALCKGIPLTDASITVLQAFYEEYNAKSSESHKILINHGISPPQIKVFNSLKRNNDDQIIPPVMIKGSQLGHRGKYLVKLDTQSDIGAGIAACGGKIITNCCQYLGGVGSDCAKHGIESPYGGFYVLFEGDENNPDLKEHPLLAMAWVWADSEGSLCLDSIEAVSSENAELVADFYRCLGITLCENPRIKRVNTGSQSGITTRVGLKDYPTSKLHAIDYRGYNDSESQLLLADDEMPYAFWGQVQSSQLQEKIESQTRQYFNRLFQEDKPLELNDGIGKAIAYWMYTTLDESFWMLFFACADSRKEELDSLFMLNRDYIEQFSGKHLEDAFALLEQGAYINAMNSKGESILHVAALGNHLDLIKRLVGRQVNLDVQDKNGNTALLHVLKTVLYTNNIQDGRNTVYYLLEHGANIDIKDKNENTPLIIAVKNQDLDMARTLLDKGANPDIYDEDMRTALYWAAEKGDWALFTELLERNARMDVINIESKNNLLMAAIRGRNKEIIELILQRSAINFAYRNRYGRTVLHCAIGDFDLLSFMLLSIPSAQKMKVIQAADLQGKTVLHLVANSNPRALAVLLEQIPDSERLAAIHWLDQNGNTVLHLAATNPDSLNVLMTLVPGLLQSELFKIPNNQGNMVLHLAANNPEVLKLFVEGVPEIAYLILLTNKLEQTVLHFAAKEDRTLRLALEPISVNERLVAIRLVDSSGNTVQHLVASSPDSLRALRELIPGVQEFDLFIANNQGETMLHLAAGNPEALEMMLERLTPDLVLQAAGLVETNQNTLLHLAACNAQSLASILSRIPKEQWYDLISKVNERGQTVLHVAARSPAVLNILLELVPDIQNLIHIPDKYGSTPLQSVSFSSYGITNESGLRTFLEFIPASDRLAAVLATDSYGNSVKSLCMQDAYWGSSEDIRVVILKELVPEVQLIELAEKIVKSAGFKIDEQKHIKAWSSIISTMSFDQWIRLFSPNIRIYSRDRENAAMIIELAAKIPKFLEAILTMMPVERRLELIGTVDEFGNTVLHQAAEYPETVNVLVTLVPELAKIVPLTNQYNETAFHIAAKNPGCFMAILKIIPNDQLLNLFRMADEHGNTVLHYIADSADCLRAALERIPVIEDRAEIMKITNEWGRSVSQQAEGHPESLRVLQELIFEHAGAKVEEQSGSDKRYGLFSTPASSSDTSGIKDKSDDNLNKKPRVQR